MVVLSNSVLSLTLCPWMTLKSYLGHRVLPGPGTTIHHVPHFLPPQISVFSSYWSYRPF